MIEKQFSRDEISLALQNKGFLVINLSSLEIYYQVCAQLGEIKHKLEVKLEQGSKIYANIEGKVPFHTDNPNIPIVAWHCLEPDSMDGANMLIDSHVVTQKLSQEDIITLTGVRLPVPYSDSDHAILNLDPYHVYWLPRMVEEAKSGFSEKELGAVKRFNTVLEELYKSAQYQNLRLQKGDTLFVNNWVMLHGRNEISGESKRHLVRVYISGDGDVRTY
ncbi:MAG: TauD/TfdA family dioxygenase [Acidobacteriota bacterium]